MLEGHSVGIDEHYCKPSEEDLQEEYLKAADLITAANLIYRFKNENGI
jgi:hypothetical protein